ncbi:hypothetical protein SAMN05421827_102115 [Pedobacter terrae]|uniref:Uncharacterized protein n=1 Tax=Pedobacter terrae TaxID=405671 RepID=A0A1G7Q0F4_9SPHI|nr:hypothetical protein SAMN05421827_102115 [Pedobacter terrae]
MFYIYQINVILKNTNLLKDELGWSLNVPEANSPEY